MKKKVGIITNASPNSGAGARAYEIAQHMPQRDDFDVLLVSLDGLKKLRQLPGLFGAKSVSWLRLARHIPKFDIYDISNQTLSFIAKKRHPNIVTVHDLIELTDPQDIRASLLNKYLLSGIKHADRVVTVSEYTKQTIIEHLGISTSLITVIPNGINTSYKPIQNFTQTIAYQELIRDFGIINRSLTIMYVGSEHPRKNLETVLRVVAILKKQYPDIFLLKVGEAGIRSGRIKTLELIDELHLRENVMLLGNIPTERINELYNIANVLLFPSRLEGFGMPPLEAMAAGCPVVCSNATSLPEVVGGGAIMHDADNIDAFAASIVHILTNDQFRTNLIERGQERAATFSWNRAANAMMNIYKTL